MRKPIIFRKRFIPLETVDISSDELLYRDSELLITAWKPIRERSDFAGGISFTFLKEGYKISRFLDGTGRFLYWYCDIVDVEYDQILDRYLINDLLLDMKLMSDGKLVILDSDELAEALESGLITAEQAGMALRRLDKLLKMVYSGNFPPEICNSREYCGWLPET